MARAVARRASRFVLAIAALLAAACDDAQEAPAPTPPTVTIAGAQMREITDSAEFVGQVEPFESAQIVARVEGYLEGVEIADGAFAREGDLMFRIEQARYLANVAAAEAEVASAEAALALAEVDLGRSAELLDRGTIAQAQYDAALAERDARAAQLDVAKASVRQAELDLDYTRIRAPFSGRIGKTAFSRGDVVGPGAGPLATLIQLRPIYVDFSISEGEWLAVLERFDIDLDAADPAGSSSEPQLPVSLRLPGGGRFEETGRIVFVDNRVDPETGTIALRAQFENERARLTPGAYVTVVVEEAQPVERLVIPQAAVQRDQRGDFVLVIGPDSMVERRYVTLAGQAETAVVVEAGLQSGESVIVEGLQRVRPGVPVDAVPETPSPAADAEG